jgi:hypothetical protein
MGSVKYSLLPNCRSYGADAKDWLVSGLVIFKNIFCRSASLLFRAQTTKI